VIAASGPRVSRSAISSGAPSGTPSALLSAASAGAAKSAISPPAKAALRTSHSLALTRSKRRGAAAPARLGFWDRLAARLLAPAQRDQRPAIDRARTILWITLAPIPILPFECTALWLTMAPEVRAWAVGLVLLDIPLSLGVLAVFRATGSTVVASNMVLCYAFAVIAAVTYWCGGVPAPAAFWMVLIPMVAVSLVGRRHAVGWALVIVAHHAAFWLAHRAGYVFGTPVASTHAAAESAASVAGLLTAVFLLVLVYERARNDAVETLAALNRSLEEARAQLDRATRAKTGFIASVSHELRTPMTAILGFADMLLDDWAGRRDLDESRDLIATVRRSGQQLLVLINDLLDLSKVEAGRLRVESIAFSPDELIEATVERFRAGAAAKGLALAVRAPGLPGAVYGDPVRVGQILTKLLDNAIEFTQQGRVEVHARLHGRGSQAELELAVRDTGPGIAPDLLPRLFDLAAPLDLLDLREAGGCGLGLALCQHLATVLGGVLHASSEPGAGSAVALRLPAPEAEPIHTSEVRAPAPSEIEAYVLLAEDSPDSQRLIAEVLRRAGARVDVADDGAIALEKLRAAVEADEPYDVVVLDMQMPVLDGAATARALRAEGHHVPILALTAESSLDERERCLAAGCDDYASKPVDRAVLLAALQRLCTRKPGSSGRPRG